MIEGENEEDNGDNDGNVKEELVTVCIDVGVPTNFVGEEVMSFFMNSKKTK
jgi:hypothetical protein